MTESPLIRVERAEEGPALQITLASDRTRNALSIEMFAALEDAMTAAERTVREGRAIAVVLRAEGRAFCSGFDLGQSVADSATLVGFVTRLSALARRLREIDAIVVASVQGPALAGGCALVAACDVVIASQAASFGYPVHRIGVSPAVTLPTLLATAGVGGARQLALSGEIVDAVRAQALGIVHRVVADEAALRHAETSTLDTLASRGPHALRETKRWLNRVDGTARDGVLGSRTEAATTATANLCEGGEAREMLRTVWNARQRGRSA